MARHDASDLAHRLGRQAEAVCRHYLSSGVRQGRYWLVGAVAARLGTVFPAGTLLVNVSGSFVIGLALTLLLAQVALAPGWRLFLVVGFLGGYTTFSSYSFEALALIEQGRWFASLGYILGSNALSLAACFGGMLLARAAR